MYNQLFDSPLEAACSKAAFSGGGMWPQCGRSFIVNGKGTMYAAYTPMEDIIKIVKSENSGFSWEEIDRIDYVPAIVDAGTVNGNIIYLFYSEVRDKLYCIYNWTYTTPAVAAFRIRNATDREDIDLNFPGTNDIAFTNGYFVACGHADRKIGIAFQNSLDSNHLHFIFIDINHYAAGVLKIRVADNKIDYGASHDVYDISENSENYYLWYVTTGGILKRQTILKSVTAESVSTSGAAETIITNTSGYSLTEIFASNEHCLALECDNATNLIGKLWIANKSTAISPTQITAGAGSFGLNYGGTIASAYGHCLELTSDNVLVFYTGNAAGTNNYYCRICTKGASNYTIGTEKTINTALTSGNSAWNKFFHVFMPLSLVKCSNGNVSGLKICYSNSNSGNFGHQSNEAMIFTEGLYNNAYPLAITSTVISKSISDYYSGGYINELTKQCKGHIEKWGIPIVILKYEPATTIEGNGFLCYDTPTEITAYCMLNTLSLKNPTNIKIENVEDYDRIQEKDIRKIFLPADKYLVRTFKKTKYGFIKRTIYLFPFFGRFFEITQIVPYFMGGSLLCYSANLYVCGPNYDPFSRFVLPNEN